MKFNLFKLVPVAGILFLFAVGVQAQTSNGTPLSSKLAASSDPVSAPPAGAAKKDEPGLTEREKALLERVDQLEKRLAEVEGMVKKPTPEAATPEPTKASPQIDLNTAATPEVHPETRQAQDQPQKQYEEPFAFARSDQATMVQVAAVRVEPNVLADAGAVNSGTSEALVKSPQAQTQTDTETAADREIFDFFRDTTFNITVDGYYGYNFNRPVGGINLLRAYDVQGNSFSLNQAALIIENAPNLEKGKRYGLRLDLQYGQTTETVQGNAANEPRPQVYRNLWQAYGTYVFDVGKGLTMDFGKFASSLGYETNYTKDNFNYSRSYYFNFLPFYHFGFRSKLPVNDKVTVMYHLINGTQQSEDFNGFKSHHFAVIVAPTKRISGQVNYYFGQEQRDRNPALNPTFAPVASQPGLSTDVIRPVPSGRLHIFDTYYTFNVTDKLTLGVEGDYVVGRVFRDSPPATVWGGVGYARYQWTPKVALAGRFEYLGEKVSPVDGLFSGVTQAMKEFTFTGEYKFADGFLGRAEYRRDFSNQPFFLSEQPGILKKEQNTATLGLVWWFGRKKGSW